MGSGSRPRGQQSQPSGLAALARLTNPVASPRRKGLSNLGLLPWKSPSCFVQRDEDEGGSPSTLVPSSPLLPPARPMLRMRLCLFYSSSPEAPSKITPSTPETKVCRPWMPGARADGCSSPKSGTRADYRCQVLTRRQPAHALGISRGC